jgi:hypothetical protein
MAEKTLLYNVTSAVGKFRSNKTDDVLLVRFFLRRISQAPDIQGPYSNMPLVASFDEELGGAIKWFQKKVAEKGKPITVDGVVDHSPNGTGYYTIRHLNKTYRTRYPQFTAIEGDPQFPGALNSSFNPARV